MVKLFKREAVAPPEGEMEPAGDACDPLEDDLDELIMSLDEDDDDSTVAKDRPQAMEDVDAVPASPGVPEGEDDGGAMPWLDRYEATNRLIEQLEETLTMMEKRGVNLTQAWELANTARSLLDSADVAQALIFANRSFRMAMDIHRFQEPASGAAS